MPPRVRGVLVNLREAKARALRAAIERLREKDGEPVRVFDPYDFDDVLLE